MKRPLPLLLTAAAALWSIACLFATFCAAADARPASASPVPSPSSPAKPRIEVCFVLDTTGSMSGLIEGAKQKIWAIANQMITAKPTPDLRFALVGYRDRGDAYVTRAHPLTDDLDAIYAQLREFSAAGGGDWPEAVNEALEAAVRRTQWSADSSTLKIIFLVGDAPPHMDYKDDTKYPVLCQEALKRGIIINTVQCGAADDTRKVWQEIARLGEGEYVAIAQEGGMAQVETPMDKRLAELNREIGGTIVPYGPAPKRAEVQQKQRAAEAAPAPAASDRLEFNARTGKAVQGGGDLLDEVASGRAAPGALKDADLPDDWRKLDAAEREKKVADLRERRAKIQTEIASLAKERADFLRKEEARLAASRKGDGFDAKVATILRAEAKRKGITLE